MSASEQELFAKKIRKEVEKNGQTKNNNKKHPSDVGERFS